MKACGGAVATSQNKRRCDNCGKEYAASSFAAHRKRCIGDAQRDLQVSGVEARVHKRERVECDQCGIPQAKTNMSRHKKTCTGGRAFHLSGERPL